MKVDEKSRPWSDHPSKKLLGISRCRERELEVIDLSWMSHCIATGQSIAVTEGEGPDLYADVSQSVVRPRVRLGTVPTVLKNSRSYSCHP